MRIYICVFLLSFSVNSFSQVYTIDQSIPVEINGETLSNPWAGGLNAGQYSTMDVNQDGIDDLVVFDRTASKTNVFINEDGKYKYEPEFSAQFPAGINNWMLLRDFNADGRKDIFTNDPLGIRVYVNQSEGNGLKWRLFNSRAPQPSPLLTKGFSASPINIQLNGSDIPSIEDIDSDGDLDILVYKFSSSPTIEFHKNMSIEVDANSDSLRFERVTQNWGEFVECICGDFAFNGEDCPPIGGGRTEHQSGKSLLTIDVDGDGDYDALVGEESCPFLSYLPNIGDSQNALMNTSIQDFPNGTNPAALFIFPAAYYEDVDFDGIKDLIVAPNVAANVNYSVDFKSSSWLYHNDGTSDKPVFSFVQTDFLQNQMIDIGESSTPLFYDYDNDGDLDLFLSGLLSQGLLVRSSIKLAKNVGTPSLPSFVMVNEDFLSLSLLKSSNLKPQFADVNNDGLKDFVFTAETSGLQSAIYYLIRNTGNFSFREPRQLLFNGIGFDENYKIFDIDGDGLLDLLIGRSTGRVEYHRNIGSVDVPFFEVQDQSFYNLDFSPFRLNASCEIADLDGDDKQDLIVGDARGNLTFYTDFLSHLEAPLEGETDLIKVGEQNMNLNFGSKIKPVAVNLFNTDKPTLVLGTGQGGLVVLKNNTGISKVTNNPIDVYPNPVQIGDELIIKSSITMTVSIVTLSGQVVLKNLLLTKGEEHKLNISLLKVGLYIVTPKSSDIDAVRFVVIR